MTTNETAKDTVTSSALLGPLLSHMIAVYRIGEKEGAEYTFALRQSIYDIVCETPKKYRPRNIPMECDGEFTGE